MFANRSKTGAANLLGGYIKTKRKELKISQRKLADNLQVLGIIIDKNAVQRIEAGKRFLTDVEIPFFAKALGVSIIDMYENAER